MDILLKILKSTTLYKLLELNIGKYGKNIKWLYIIIFQSLTLKYWFYIIYDFLSVFSYSNFIYTNNIIENL